MSAYLEAPVTIAVLPFRETPEKSLIMLWGELNVFLSNLRP